MNHFADEPVRIVKPKGAAGAASDAVAFVRERLRIEPDARQEEVLRSTAKQGVLNCSRQWGKSTIAAAKAVHRAYVEPKSLVLVASPTERQSGELLRKASEMVMQLGIKPRGDGTNTASLLFPNGSRIVALPGIERTVRGFSRVSLLLIDEAARVEDRMYRALQPMLAVGEGDLWLMSTPCGKRGFFYNVWAHGGAAWMKVQVAATECPRISKTFLDAARLEMGPAWFEQEYLCGFVDNGMGMFERGVVQAAMDPAAVPLDLPSRWRR